MTNLMQSLSTAAARSCLTACFHLSQKYNWNVCGAIFLLTVEGISERTGGNTSQRMRSETGGDCVYMQARDGEKAIQHLVKFTQPPGSGIYHLPYHHSLNPPQYRKKNRLHLSPRVKRTRTRGRYLQNTCRKHF